MKSFLRCFFVLLLVVFSFDGSVAQEVGGKVAKDKEAEERAERNREAVSCQLKHLAQLAQEHYEKPASEGGGNGSFDGSTQPGAANPWYIPGEIDTTANGIYVITHIASNVVTIIGIGRETGADRNFLNANSETSKVQVSATVSSTIVSVILMN